jgi:hypothetical protein
MLTQSFKLISLSARNYSVRDFRMQKAFRFTRCFKEATIESSGLTFAQAILFGIAFCQKLNGVVRGSSYE